MVTPIVVDGRYRVLETMDESDLRSVFLTEHELIRRKLVVKMLSGRAVSDHETVARFLSEAEIAGRLRHPNIVESMDMGFANGQPYVVFEHLQGVALDEELGRLGRLPIRRAVHIARQVAAALGAAHLEDILHGSLDAASVFLVDRDNDPDFVKVLGLGSQGEPTIPAPEQVLGEGLDHRVDVWALGVLLYTMVMGRAPFAVDATSPSGRRRILTNPPLAIDRGDVPEELQQVILACLAKNPDDRIGDMAELFDALAPFEHRLARGSHMTIPPTMRSRSARMSMVGMPVMHTPTPVPAPAPAPEPVLATSPAAAVPRSRKHVLLVGIGAAFAFGAAGLALTLGGSSAATATAQAPALVAAVEAPVVAPEPAPVQAPKPRIVGGPAVVEAAPVTPAKPQVRVAAAATTKKRAPAKVAEVVKPAAIEAAPVEAAPAEVAPVVAMPKPDEFVEAKPAFAVQKPAATGPVRISSSVLEAHRLAGSPAIGPDNAARQAIKHMGASRVTGTFDVCVAKTGAVSVKLASSTGITEFDRKILKDMNGWKFRPFTVGGEPTASCARFTIAYSMQ